MGVDVAMAAGPIVGWFVVVVGIRVNGTGCFVGGRDVGGRDNTRGPTW